MEPAPVQLMQCIRNSSFSLTGGFTTEDGPAEGNLNSLYLQKPLKSSDTAAAAELLQSCPTVRPHRRQPTRLPHPWDSPGKNTAAGCHFLLQCMKVKSQSEVAESCPTPSDPMHCSLPGSSVYGFSRQEYWSGVPLPSSS